MLLKMFVHVCVLSSSDAQIAVYSNGLSMSYKTSQADTKK